MARKQVDLDLGTQALQPTAQRAGQYRVAVQQTPKTNSALQLAQALRYTPQILGQASNIAQKMGAEAALNATDVEGEMLDDETKGILGYDKAYQQGLVKRHFSMNEESIKTRFKNLASSEEFLKMDPDQFVAALQGERQQFNDELMDQFGGNGNREQAINALSSTFVDDILDSTTAEWTDNKKQQTEMFISGDAQSMFKTKGVAAGLSYQSTELASLGMSPKERSQAMRNSVQAHTEGLILAGKLKEAENIMAQGSAYKLGGKHGLFGSTEGKTQLNTITAKLQTALKTNDRSASDTKKIHNAYVGSVSDSYRNLRSGAVSIAQLSEAQQEQLKTSLELLSPTATPEEIDEMASEVFTGDGEPIQNFTAKLLELGVQGSDSAQELYYGTKSSLDRALERLDSRVALGITLTPDHKTEIIKDYEEWYSANRGTAEEWIDKTNQNFNAFTTLNTKSNELNAGSYVTSSVLYKNIGTDVRRLATTLSKDVKVYKQSPFSLNSVTTLLEEQMQNQMVDYARDLANDPDKNVKNQQFHKQLFEDIEERMIGLRTAYSTQFSEITPEENAAIEKTDVKVKGTKRRKITYKTLKDNFAGSGATRQGRESIKQERQTMLENNHRPQMQLSLVRDGFERYDVKNLETLDFSALDAGDVKLFGSIPELNIHAFRFGEVLEADTGLNTLTEEQKAIRDEYQKLGITDQADLNEFIRIQDSLLK